MFCSGCGAKNEDAARFCLSCGVALAATTPENPGQSGGAMRGTGQVQSGGGAAKSEKNPVLATILSVVIVGLGQFYNGDWKKGLAMLIGVIILAVPTAGVAWLGIAIWSAIDAYNVAKGKGKMW
jgi:TM2 domain-containing membrane protein YozV